jgi:hypothetical protein
MIGGLFICTKEILMRRDTFLKSMAALAVSGGFPLSALAGANIKMMIPANPGGGWDTTGRALGKALQDAKVADTVTYDNKGGAAGALGLAQFVNGSKSDPNAMMVMGQVMLGGIITGKPPVNLSTRHATGAADQRIQRLRAARQLPFQVHEGSDRTTEEGSWQRQMGRRVAGLH